MSSNTCYTNTYKIIKNKLNYGSPVGYERQISTQIYIGHLEAVYGFPIIIIYNEQLSLNNSFSHTGQNVTVSGKRYRVMIYDFFVPEL